MNTPICIAGKNRIAVEAAQFIQRNFPGLPLRVVVNRTDTGHDTWQPSLKKWATDSAIPICSLDELYPVDGMLFLSLEYDRLIKPSAFQTKNLFNIHFSHLPEYKGMYTSIWPLLDGKEYSGVTLHRIDPGIDTGDIIAQSKFPLSPDTTARDLYELYLIHGLELFQCWLPKLLTGAFHATPQPAQGSTYRSKRSLDFANLRIDLQQTAAAIHNQVRGFTFPEYQLPQVLGHNIHRSEILRRRSTFAPGTLIRETPAALELASVDYDIVCHKDPLSAFIAACEHSDLPAARLHLDRLPHLEARNAKGWTALAVAAYHAQRELVASLLKEGAHVNATNWKGTSVLMYAKSGAVRTGDLASLALLLSSGADPRHRDHSGRNVLDYARAEGAEAVIAELERHQGA